MDSQLVAWIAGLSLGASLVVAVGAQNTFVLQQGLRRERVGLVVAVCLGLDAILMSLGVSGVAAALGSHPALLAAMGWAGAAFLLWYAWQAARRALAGQALATDAGGVRRAPARAGVRAPRRLALARWRRGGHDGLAGPAAGGGRAARLILRPDQGMSGQA